MTDIAALEALAKKGHECLARGQAKQALDIGRELETKRFSAGFEVQALALNALERRSEAITVLQQGVDKVSHVWLLWQLLGNYLSDANRYNEAFAAYGRGLACEAHDERSLHFNYATAASRAGDSKTALTHLDAVLQTEQPLEDWHHQIILLSRVLKLVIYNDLGRYEDTQAAFLSFFSDDELWRDYPEEFSRAAGQQAYALWRTGNIKGARAFVDHAIAANKFNENAHWLDREIRLAEGGTTAKTRYTLTIAGEWPTAEDIAGDGHAALPSGAFYTRYNIVADSKTEAFAIARQFEPKETRASLKLVDAQQQSGEPIPKGVYSTSRYFEQPEAAVKRAVG